MTDDTAAAPAGAGTEAPPAGSRRSRVRTGVAVTVWVALLCGLPLLARDAFHNDGGLFRPPINQHRADLEYVAVAVALVVLPVAGLTVARRIAARVVLSL